MKLNLKCITKYRKNIPSNLKKKSTKFLNVRCGHAKYIQYSFIFIIKMDGMLKYSRRFLVIFLFLLYKITSVVVQRSCHVTYSDCEL